MIYKGIIITVIVLFIATINYAQQADDIIGKYHLPNKLDIEIFKNNSKYSGKIIALNGYEGGQTTDFKNPNLSKKDDLLLGKVIINNLVFDTEEKHWVNGEMYGPEKGVVFNLKIVKIRENEIEVVGSKYIFWRTLEWKKL